MKIIYQSNIIRSSLIEGICGYSHWCQAYVETTIKDRLPTINLVVHLVVNFSEKVDKKFDKNP